MSEQKGTPLPEGMVTSEGVAQKKWVRPVLPPRERIIATVVVVILILGGAIAAHAAYSGHQKQVAYQKKLQQEAANLPPDYSRLTDSQLGIKVEADSGYTLDEVRTKTFTERSFSNFGKAYAVAKALFVTKQFKKSVGVYQIAETKAPQGVTYAFYEDYAQSALYAGNDDLWKAKLGAAKRAVNDSGMPVAGKQNITATIDREIKLKALGY